jgi:hypothetical protein
VIGSRAIRESDAEVEGLEPLQMARSSRRAFLSLAESGFRRGDLRS